MTLVHLHPGQLVASSEPCTVTTILGSCVAVCLWDEVRAVGGMNHFLLPFHTGSGAASPRFGTAAMEQLWERVVGLGARPAALQAQVYGGASVLEAFRARSLPLGQQNVELARRFLEDARVPVVAEDTLGHCGRRLTFSTHDGSTSVRLLSAPVLRPVSLLTA